jgi:hypothetical protein
MKKNYNYIKTKSSISEIDGYGLTTQNASNQALFRKMFLFLIFGLLCLPVLKAQTIMGFESGLQSMEAASAAHLQSLAADINPNVYLAHGEFTTNGEGAPLVAICDGSSVNMLYGNDPALSQVELITITVNSANELPSVIELSRMQGLTNLKYLLVVFAYDVCGGKSEGCLESKLNGIIQADSSPVNVFYKLSIPE